MGAMKTGRMGRALLAGVMAPALLVVQMGDSLARDGQTGGSRAGDWAAPALRVAQAAPKAEPGGETPLGLPKPALPKPALPKPALPNVRPPQAGEQPMRAAPPRAAQPAADGAATPPRQRSSEPDASQPRQRPPEADASQPRMRPQRQPDDSQRAPPRSDSERGQRPSGDRPDRRQERGQERPQEGGQERPQERRPDRGPAGARPAPAPTSAPTPQIAPARPPATDGMRSPSAPSAAPAPAPNAAPAAAPPRVPDRPPPGSQRQGSGRQGSGRQGSGRIGPAGAAALGAAAGLVGGFLLARPGEGPASIDAVKSARREYRDKDAYVYQEPGRTIVRDGDRYFLRHDENERFRALGGDLRSERRGDHFVSIYKGRDGDEIFTVTDADGNLIRRYRRGRDGSEVVIIDNSYRGGPRAYADEIVVLPPPALRIARERYIVDAAEADERLLYDTLTAPPVAPIPRRFTLDEIRSSPDVRAYTRSVDLDTVNFDTGSWTLAPDQARKLAMLAQALNKAIQGNPNEVFLVEGHTDAVGTPVDNLSLSDRRAQAVAEILTREFAVPPENLTVQGYGEQYLRVATQEPERRNRRVVVRRITNLLSGQNQ
ncbi:MAG: OmpA family protein [Rhodoblastus sp.]